MGTTYILASERNGTLYTGVTSDLYKRVYQHKQGKISGFSKKYDIYQLVWYQEFTTIDEAILYEKKIKGKNRAYKIQLIEESNKTNSYQNLFRSKRFRLSSRRDS